MVHLLCRNRVADFDRWWRVFDSHVEAHRAAGLHLLHVWRDRGDPAEVWFVFEAASVERARAFVEDPAGAEAGREAGVLDGELRFLTVVERP